MARLLLEGLLAQAQHTADGVKHYLSAREILRLPLVGERLAAKHSMLIESTVTHADRLATDLLTVNGGESDAPGAIEMLQLSVSGTVHVCFLDWLLSQEPSASVTMGDMSRWIQVFLGEERRLLAGQHPAHRNLGEVLRLTDILTGLQRDNDVFGGTAPVVHMVEGHKRLEVTKDGLRKTKLNPTRGLASLNPNPSPDPTLISDLLQRKGT